MTEQTKTNPQPIEPVYIVAVKDMQLPIDGSANKRKPESIYETQGWDEGLPFDCSTVNYIWNNQGKWIDYLNKQRPLDLQPILDKLKVIEEKHAEDIKSLTDKHTKDMSSANDRMTAMQIKIGGYYHGGSANPATHLLYGTWIKLDADLTLRSAEVDGSVTGDNNPAVPLKKHKHDVTVSNGGAHKPTATQKPHAHELLGTTQIGGSTDPLAGSAVAGEFDGGNVYSLNGKNGQPLIKNAAPLIIVSPIPAHLHTAICKDTGEDTPTISVRGKHIPCVIWKRSA